MILNCLSYQDAIEFFNWHHKISNFSKSAIAWHFDNWKFFKGCTGFGKCGSILLIFKVLHIQKEYLHLCSYTHCHIPNAVDCTISFDPLLLSKAFHRDNRRIFIGENKPD
jgi:hypothetical protein